MRADTSEKGIGACLFRDRPALVATAGRWKERWRFRRLEPRECPPRHGDFEKKDLWMSSGIPEQFDKATSQNRGGPSGTLSRTRSASVCPSLVARCMWRESQSRRSERREKSTVTGSPANSWNWSDSMEMDASRKFSVRSTVVPLSTNSCQAIVVPRTRCWLALTMAYRCPCWLLARTSSETRGRRKKFMVGRSSSEGELLCNTFAAFLGADVFNDRGGLWRVPCWGIFPFLQVCLTSMLETARLRDSVLTLMTTRSSVEPRRYLEFVLRCGRLGTGSLGLNCVLRLIARTLGMETRSLLVSTSTSFNVLLVFSRCNVHVLLL